MSQCYPSEWFSQFAYRAPFTTQAAPQITNGYDYSGYHPTPARIGATTNMLCQSCLRGATAQPFVNGCSAANARYRSPAVGCQNTKLAMGCNGWPVPDPFGRAA